MTQSQGIKKALIHTERHGGYTMRVNDNEPLTLGEWLVGQGNRPAFEGLTVEIPFIDRDNDKHIKDIIKLADFIKRLNRDDYYLGFWYNEYEGTIIVEPAVEIKDTHIAIVEGIRHNEIEIFNLNRHETIDLELIKYEMEVKK